MWPGISEESGWQLHTTAAGDAEPNRVFAGDVGVQRAIRGSTPTVRH